MRKFLALGWRERWFILRCWLVVAAVRGGLTFASYDALRSRIAALDARHLAGEGELRRIAWGVTAAARFVPGATCLTQAVAGQYLLARNGRAARIRFGVERGTGNDLRAHAWLVSGQHVVLGGPATSFMHYAYLDEHG